MGRCSLCGGKLNGQNICTECGLNNSKSDKNYKINQSSCDSRPLTHVHQEEQKRAKETGTSERSVQRMPRQQTGPVKAGNQKKRGKNNGARIMAIASICLVLSGILVPLIQEFAYHEDPEPDSEYEEIDPYEYVEREIPEEGSTEEYILGRGEYVVGVHIPEGNYTADAEDDFDVVQVEDPANGIYLYEYMDKEEGNYLDDLRLYSGAHVMIETDTVMRLSTENARITEMYGIKNPWKENIQITGEQTAEAGKDFVPGVYDLKALEGYGTLEVMLRTEGGEDSGEEYTVRQIYFSGEDHTEYKNLVLAEGMKLVFEDAEAAAVSLISSETIEGTEYDQYYTLGEGLTE